MGLWEEAVGVLRGCDLDAGILEFDDFTVIIRSELLHRVPELRSLLNNRIHILRTNLPSHPLILYKDRPRDSNCAHEGL